MKGVGQMRIYLIDTIRKHASTVFGLGPMVDSGWYSSGYDRATVPLFTDLLKSPKKPHEVYPAYPRVLFTDYEVVDRELFGSAAILNVSRLHPVHISCIS